MPFVVRVRDFQSIGETVTVEVNGLTVVTGPNNTGKTALMRAIFGLFTNMRGNLFVKAGREAAQVEIEFADGQKVLWEKGAKVNRYEMNGKTLTKVGAGAPPEISTLGIGSIEAAGRELWPQFAHQFVGQLFLLNEPGSVLAEAISNVDKVGVLNEALRLSQSDRRSTASDLKLRQEDVSRNEEALRKFDGLDEAVERVRAVELLGSKIGKGKKLLEGLKGLRERHSTSQGVLKTLLPIREVTIPATGNPAHELQEIEGLRVSRERLKASRATVGELAPVREIGSPEPELMTRAQRALQGLELIRGTKGRLTKAVEERDRIGTIADHAKKLVLPDPRTVLEAREALDAARGLASKLKQATGAVEELRASLSSIVNEHSTAQTEVADLFIASGECPFCGVRHEAHPH